MNSYLDYLGYSFPKQVNKRKYQADTISTKGNWFSNIFIVIKQHGAEQRFENQPTNHLLHQTPTKTKNVVF